MTRKQNFRSACLAAAIGMCLCVPGAAKNDRPTTSLQREARPPSTVIAGHTHLTNDPLWKEGYTNDSARLEAYREYLNFQKTTLDREDKEREREQRTTQIRISYERKIWVVIMTYTIVTLVIIVLLFMFNKYMNLKRHRMDLYADLLRNKVEINPENIELMGLNRKGTMNNFHLTFNSSTGKTLNLMSEHLTYIVQRVGLAILAVFIGTILSVSTDWGFWIAAALILASVLLFQALMAYQKAKTEAAIRQEQMRHKAQHDTSDQVECPTQNTQENTEDETEQPTSTPL